MPRYLRSGDLTFTNTECTEASFFIAFANTDNEDDKGKIVENELYIANTLMPYINNQISPVFHLVYIPAQHAEGIKCPNLAIRRKDGSKLDINNATNYIDMALRCFSTRDDLFNASMFRPPVAATSADKQPAQPAIRLTAKL